MAAAFWGRVLVPLLQAEGHEVTVLTRRQNAQLPGDARRIVGDLATGAGLDTVPEAEVVVHLATSPFRPARVDVGGTGALVEQIRRRGSGPHLVYVSIVGVDQISWPYDKRKRQAEALVSGSGLPFTIQRATQFHDLVLLALAYAARVRVLLVPAHTCCQPADAADVAQRLAGIARTGPVNGFADDLGGPQILDAARLARDVVEAIGVRRPLRPVWIPGRAGAGFRAAHQLAADTPRGARTWRAYLEDRRHAEPGVLRLPPIPDGRCASGAAEGRARHQDAAEPGVVWPWRRPAGQSPAG